MQFNINLTNFIIKENKLFIFYYKDYTHSEILYHSEILFENLQNDFKNMEEVLNYIKNNKDDIKGIFENNLLKINVKNLTFSLKNENIISQDIYDILLTLFSEEVNLLKEKII